MCTKNGKLRRFRKFSVVEKLLKPQIKITSKWTLESFGDTLIAKERLRDRHDPHFSFTPQDEKIIFNFSLLTIFDFFSNPYKKKHFLNNSLAKKKESFKCTLWIRRVVAKIISMKEHWEES